MSPGLAPFAVWILFHAPGRAWLSRTPEGEAPGASRLLREVLFSASITSWIGLSLAELGAYSWERLCALQLAATGLGLLFRFRRGQPHPGYGRCDAMLVVYFLLAVAWTSPPLDTRLLSGDSSGYLASGLQLSRTGSLVIHDTTVQDLSLDERRTLFPSVAADRGSPPYLRLQGSMVLRSLDSDEVLPAFHHLLTVWTAISCDLLGFGRCEWCSVLFGGLAVAAISGLAIFLGGDVAGAITAMILLVTLPQWWYSRFLMPEVPAQFFLWGGLGWLGQDARRSPIRPTTALGAGLALGVAGMMRIESAFFVGAALLGSAFFMGNLPRLVPVATGVAAGPWLHTFAHLFCLRTHYWGNLALFFRDLPKAAWYGAWGIALATPALLWRAFRRQQASVSLRLATGILLGLAALATAVDLSRGGGVANLLVSYLGLPVLVLAVIGLCAETKVATRDFAALLLRCLLALVFVQVVLAPNAAPVPIWEIRRAVPVLIPGIALFVALGLSTLAGKHKWRGILVATLLAGSLLHKGSRFFSSNLYAGAGHHLNVLEGMLEDGGVLLVDPRVAGYGIAPQVWALKGIEAYAVPGSNVEILTEWTRRFAPRPVFWLGDGNLPVSMLPRESIPVGRYKFIFETPELEEQAAPLGIVSVETDFVVYRLSAQY